MIVVAAVWEPLTAIATLALAGVTAGLAWSTRRLAREAGDETRANWMPVLSIESLTNEYDSGVGVSIQDPTRLTMKIINIGRGPALSVSASLLRDGAERAPARAQLDRRDIAPDSSVIATWSDFERPPPPELSAPGVWTSLDGVLIYGDVAYDRYETRFTAGFGADGSVDLMGAPNFVAHTALRGTIWERARRVWSWRRARAIRRTRMAWRWARSRGVRSAP